MAVAKTRRRNAPVAQVTYFSADERRAAGKALRDEVAARLASEWKPARDRRDPVEILHESNDRRLPQLIPIRFGRMAQSPFAFYRGAAAVMAADLATTPASGLRVQACGDAHLMNFGGFATPERNIFFDINDFDETLPAPWEWDVKQLAASIVIAARHIGLPDSEAARAATGAVCCYRERMADYASMRALDVWYDRIDLDCVLKLLSTDDVSRMKKTVERARKKSAPEFLFPKLVEHQGSQPRIKDEPPLIFHPSEEQAPGQRTRYVEAIEGYRASLPEHVRTLFDRFRFADLAIKVVGVGSVGTFCSIALFMAADDDPIFLQVEEARASVLEPYAGKSLHRNHGERVVAGQRLCSRRATSSSAGRTGRKGATIISVSCATRRFRRSWTTGTRRCSVNTASFAPGRWRGRRTLRGRGAHGRLHGFEPTVDDAVCEFAVEYADQNLRDYRDFVKGIREGRVPVVCLPAKASMFSRRKACRGKSQKPRSLDSRVAGNQDFEAYRQRLPRGDDEPPGRNESKRECGLENA